MAAEQNLTLLQRGLWFSGLGGRLKTSLSLNYKAIQAYDSVIYFDAGIFLNFPKHGRLERAQILNVDASGAVLNEHLGELHGGGDASMASVCIRDDGIQVVLMAIRIGSNKNCTEFIYISFILNSPLHTQMYHSDELEAQQQNAIVQQIRQLCHPSINHWSLGALVWLHATSLLQLLAIVEELGSEELIHLMRRLAGILMPQEAMNHDCVCTGGERMTCTAITYHDLPL